MKVGYGFPAPSICVCHSYCDCEINLCDILGKTQLSNEIAKGLFSNVSENSQQNSRDEIFLWKFEEIYNSNVLIPAKSDEQEID